MSRAVNSRKEAKRGETLLDALHREVEEELGLKRKDYRVVSSKRSLSVSFLNGRKKDGYDGQEQHYFSPSSLTPSRLSASKALTSFVQHGGSHLLPSTWIGLDR